MSGSGISWAICKSAPRSRQITMPAPHYSVFYRPDALPAAQPTASKHWRQETWPVRKENVVALQRAEMRIVSWMCGVKLKDRLLSKELRERLGIDDIALVLQQNRLRWYGHVLRKDYDDWVKKCMEYEVEGPRQRGRPKRNNLIPPYDPHSIGSPLPQLHASYISSPSHRHLFASHDRTSAAYSAAIPMLCHLHLVSLSAPYLGVYLLA